VLTWDTFLKCISFSLLCSLLIQRGLFKAYSAKTVAYNGFGGMFHLFVEKVAKQENSFSGNYFSGLPVVEGERDAEGKPLEHQNG